MGHQLARVTYWILTYRKSLTKSAIETDTTCTIMFIPTAQQTVSIAEIFPLRTDCERRIKYKLYFIVIHDSRVASRFKFLIGASVNVTSLLIPSFGVAFSRYQKDVCTEVKKK